jgi:hypothetical protein
MFTSHGKVVKNNWRYRSRSFRDPSKIDNSYTHSKLRELSEVVRRIRLIQEQE